MSRPKPRIALTMGDPAGVGPEVTLRALADPGLSALADLIVYGDQAVLDAAAERMGLRAAGTRQVVDCGCLSLGMFEPGTVTAATGRAGYTYVDEAIGAAKAGDLDGIVTAPLNKEALRAAGIAFPGHTEIFAAKLGSERFCMLQYSDVLSCTFVTVHVGYREVPGLITRARVLEVIELTREAFVRIRKAEPKIVVLGLNPHAGEHGLFGESEEEKFIEPAVRTSRDRGWRVEGPIPPDTAFLKKRLAETDCFVCMYHDQGHIPVKALAFEKSVNTTLGLPIPRTSVDHGTALDIAWQGVADPSSMFEAVKLNATLCGSA
ncbi:MAG: 4-hydroxythreonine-4-phosphate dehydrogenase PdxA [Verrucomicrobiales bacterium]